MVSEKIKNALANANGLTKERKAELINEYVREQYRLEEEIAIARKVINLILEIMEELHPDITTDPRYKEAIYWNSVVEAIKERVDKEVQH